MFVWSRYSVGDPEGGGRRHHCCLHSSGGLASFCKAPENEGELLFMHIKRTSIVKAKITRRQTEGRRALWFAWCRLSFQYNFTSILSHYIHRNSNGLHDNPWKLKYGLTWNCDRNTLLLYSRMYFSK